MRGSEQLTKEIRDAAVTYNKVIHISERGFTLDCGHVMALNPRNPAHLGQVRYCQQCTEANLHKTGEI